MISIRNIIEHAGPHQYKYMYVDYMGGTIRYGSNEPVGIHNIRILKKWGPQFVPTLLKLLI